MIVNNLYLIRAIFFLLSFISFPIHDNKSVSNLNSDRARTLHSELTYINVLRGSDTFLWNSTPEMNLYY